MPPEMSEHGSESSSVDAPAIAKASAAVDRDGKLPPTDSASKAVPPANQRFTLRRKLLIGVHRPCRHTASPSGHLFAHENVAATGVNSGAIKSSR